MIVLDVESTGLSPVRNSIVSLGALDLENSTNRFYAECRVWEGSEIEDEALAINGFTRNDIEEGSGKQSEAELITAFVEWAKNGPRNRMLAAQNPSFDLEFVQEACKRAGIPCPFGKRTIDVHSLTWLHMTLRGEVPLVQGDRSAINLDAALVYCGISEEPKPHNALTGALCHAEVISRVAYNKKELPEFKHFEIPWILHR